MEQLKLDSQLRKGLENFISSKHRNVWVSTSQLEVYVRKGHHMVNRHMYIFLDIANVTVKEELRHRGLFKQLLELFKSLSSSYNGVYVESILNPHLESYISGLAEEDHRWHHDPISHCYAWLKEGK
jgi:hypothetical protein